MTRRIGLLDCTLRDGGFVNDWKFNHSVITSIYKRLDKANVDIIEVGFLDDRRDFDIDRTIMPNTQSLNKIYGNVEKHNSMAVAMIDFGTCDIENIQNCCDTFIDGIRVIFKKKDYVNALNFCKKIMDKGYKLFVQPVSITSYSDKDMLELIEKVNLLKPFTISIVDTYGLMHKEELTHYFYLMDNNLDKDINIGYHSHNNFQLAYSNSIELLSLITNRNIFLDASVYGMGKGAGNTNTELLAMYMNDSIGKNYNISQILEIIDSDLINIYKKYQWGYSFNYFLSASNDCHPKYVKYLVDKKTLSVSSVNKILSKLEQKDKLTFNEEYIENLYRNYQTRTLDDASTYEKITETIKNKAILIIGPGKNALIELQKIEKYVSENQPITFSTNFIPTFIDVDYVFISNAKRYSKFADLYSSINIKTKILATTNIEELDVPIDLRLSYESLLVKENLLSDNSLLMLINALINMKVKNVVLAGFDGLYGDNNNYVSENLVFNSNEKTDAVRNELIRNKLNELSSKITIDFLTKTLYEVKK